MIASQAVRAAPRRRAAQPRPRHAVRAERRPAAGRRAGVTWEIRTFVAVSAAIAALFLVAMLYLAQATAISTRGYEAQQLEQVRDELRRQNALLQVEDARLDSPARIESEAPKLGLVRAATIPVVQLEPIAAKR